MHRLTSLSHLSLPKLTAIQILVMMSPNDSTPPEDTIPHPRSDWDNKSHPEWARPSTFFLLPFVDKQKIKLELEKSARWNVKHLYFPRSLNCYWNYTEHTIPLGKWPNRLKELQIRQLKTSPLVCIGSKAPRCMICVIAGS